MMLLFNPVTYFVITLLIGAPRGDASTYRRIVVAALLAFLLPPFVPIGEWGYRLVARNRYRLSENSACAVNPVER